MVVDSTISASDLAYSRISSWTRLRAQITTSASPMSLLPLIVKRSGAPGPAPINHTLPKPRTSTKNHGRQIHPLPPEHLPRRHDFLTLDPEPRTVHGALQPTLLLSDPQHLREPAPTLVANDRLEACERLPQRPFSRRERQQREPSVAFEENRPTARSQILHRRDPWHGLDLNVRFHLPDGTRQVGEGRIDVRVADGGEGARLAVSQAPRDFACGVGPVTLPGFCVVREGEEEACDPPFVQVLAH